VEFGVTEIVPPLKGSEYEVPLEPVTFTEAVLVSVTVSVTDWPELMLVELALIDTVGRLLVVTVMVVLDDALVLDGPVAFAVYVVVEDGVTVMVPPEIARLYDDPSVPVTLSAVALEAVTVSVSDVPGLIELFAAVIETVGAGAPAITLIVVWALALPVEFVAVAV